MKKLLLATTFCLMATSVFAGGLDEEEQAEQPQQATKTEWVQSSNKTSKSYKLYTSIKGFGSFMTKETEFSGSENSHTDFDKLRMGLGLTAGLKFDNIRTVLEVSRFGKTDNAEIYSEVYSRISNKYNVMLNGYYDFKNKTAFTPYVGAGVGLARIRGRVTEIGAKTTTNLAWQAGAGVSYTLNKQFDIDLGYRYLDNGNVKLDYNDGKVDLKSKLHQVYTGLRFNF